MSGSLSDLNASSPLRGEGRAAGNRNLHSARKWPAVDPDAILSPGQRPSLDAWFWLSTAAFVLNHVWSYRYNRDLDRQGTPNIGTLMFTPYLRIVPMHITIITGGLMEGGGLLLFGSLKTGADVLMHVVEHRRIKKVAAGESFR